MAPTDPKPTHYRLWIEPLVVLLSYGFRPFFLLAGAYALVAMLVWLLTLSGWWLPPGSESLRDWHAHEMIFGFAGAAVGGFLLTAVPNWTGRPIIKGVPLSLLVMAWLLGRVVVFWPLPTGSYLALLGLLYPGALAIIVAGYVVPTRNGRNYHVALIVVALAVTDLAYRLSVLGYVNLDSTAVLTLGLHLLLLLLVIISGRVVPAFTGSWLRTHRAERLPAVYSWLEVLVIPTTLLVAVADAWLPSSGVTGVLAIFAAIVHAVRLAGWRGLAVRSEPLLLVLHAGYLWLVVGYLLLGMASFGSLSLRSDAIHALTIGAIGTMVLALMSRASLGHTGRVLKAPVPVVVAYLVIGVAAMVRVAGGWMPSINLQLLVLSGMLWMLAYALFLVGFFPILLQPRIDGRPG